MKIYIKLKMFLFENNKNCAFENFFLLIYIHLQIMIKIQSKGKINLCQKQENLNYIENKRDYLFQNFQKQLEYAYLYLK